MLNIKQGSCESAIVRLGFDSLVRLDRSNQSRRRRGAGGTLALRGTEGTLALILGELSEIYPGTVIENLNRIYW